MSANKRRTSRTARARSLSRLVHRRANHGGIAWRRHSSVALLGLGCILLCAVALQAYSAVRSQHVMMDRLLSDYARAAAWNYRRQLEPRLGTMLDHLFHPLHDVAPDGVRERLPEIEAIEHMPHTEEFCGFSEIGSGSDVLRFSGAGLRSRWVTGCPRPKSTRFDKRSSDTFEPESCCSARRGSLEWACRTVPSSRPTRDNRLPRTR